MIEAILPRNLDSRANCLEGKSVERDGLVEKESEETKKRMSGKTQLSQPAHGMRKGKKREKKEKEEE